jgi:hypothetical protein
MEVCIRGSQFDTSNLRPVSFPLKAVIKGWGDALQLMAVGSKWELFVPPALGYGDKGARDKIGPNATLIFELELLAINGSSEDRNLTASPTRRKPPSQRLGRRFTDPYPTLDRADRTPLARGGGEPVLEELAASARAR